MSSYIYRYPRTRIARDINPTLFFIHCHAWTNFKRVLLNLARNPVLLNQDLRFGIKLTRLSHNVNEFSKQDNVTYLDLENVNLEALNKN